MPIAPGVYDVEIERCVQRTSRAGTLYLEVVLIDVRSRHFLCVDVLPLTGWRKNVGYAKLRQLGFDETVKKLDVSSLVGRRVQAWIEHDDYWGESRVNTRELCCGYLRASDDVSHA